MAFINHLTASNVWITVTNSNRNPGAREIWPAPDSRDRTSREEVWADEVAAVSISEVVEDTVSVSLQKEKKLKLVFQTCIPIADQDPCGSGS